MRPSPAASPTPLPQARSAKQMPNLDMLRAFAVALVVLDHTALARGIHHLPGGWLAEWVGIAGVSIFFVHTALVLMWSLERKPHTLDFYIRRVFRIYPLAIVAILAAVLFHAPVNGTVTHFFEYHAPSGKNIFFTSLLVQNIVPRQQNIIGVLWTLPLEVQMYLALPVLFAFVRRERAVWPLLLLWLLTCLTCRSVFPAVFSALPMAVPCFLPGIMAYVLFPRVAPRLPAALLLPVTFALTCGFMLRPNFRTAWVFCLALGLLLPFFRQLRTPWVTRTAHELAKYSFGIYLTHPFALALGFYLLAGHSLALQLTVEFLAIAAFSVTGYHLIEKPFIRLGSRVASRVERRVEHVDSTDPYTPTSLDNHTPGLPSASAR